MTKNDSIYLQQQLDEAQLRLKLEYQQIPFGVLSLLIITAISPVFAKRMGKDIDINSLTINGYFIFVGIAFSFFLLIYILVLVDIIGKRKRRIRELKAELESQKLQYE